MPADVQSDGDREEGEAGGISDRKTASSIWSRAYADPEGLQVSFLIDMLKEAVIYNGDCIPLPCVI